MDTKTCPRCGRTLPRTLEHWYHPPSGWSAYCRSCMREYGNEWQRNNPDKRLAHRRKHAASHKDELAAYQRTRRSRRLGKGGTHTAEEAAAQAERQHGKCFYCGKKLPKKFHMDHVWPVSRGGHSGIENLVACCPHCNCTKRDKTPMDFAGILL